MRKKDSTAADEYVAKSLRRGGKAVTLAVNKCESRDPVLMAAEFHALALGEPIGISAAHEQGVGALMEQVLDGLAPGETPGARGSRAFALRSSAGPTSASRRSSIGCSAKNGSLRAQSLARRATASSSRSSAMPSATH